jgi:Helix-turn-helix domain
MRPTPRPRSFDEWLSSAQVAELLGISTTRVGQLRRESRLEATATPLGYLYHRGALDELLAARYRHPAGAA